MSANAGEVIGAIAACAGAGSALCLRDPRARYLAVGVALAAAAALILGQVWDQSRFADIRDEPAVLVLALLLLGTALVAAAATFGRAPAAIAIAAFTVLPLRVPVQFGGETNFLLLPLYGVIAAAFARAAWLLARGRADQLAAASSPSADQPGAVRWLCIALAAALVAYGIGVAWSDDPDYAIKTVAFFLAPFASLMVILRDLRWYRKLFGQVLLATALMAGVYALIALYQYVTRDLLLNKDLGEANQLHLYYRVNSLFKDPNILGRYLALAMVGIGAYVSWPRNRNLALAGLGACALLLGALAFTFSITSFAALVAALCALLWFRLGPRGLGTAVAILAIGVGVFALVGKPGSGIGKQRDLADVTSGRSNLVAGGIDLFEKRPIVGYGSGSFARAYQREINQITRPISHSEPVTVAAEQGFFGLIPLVASLALAASVLLRPWPSRSPERAGIAAAAILIFVHSLGYANFLTDPATWAILALGVIAAVLERGAGEPPPQHAAA